MCVISSVASLEKTEHLRAYAGRKESVSYLQ
jgi:hypothetical protein